MAEIKKIAVTTYGGDSPKMNAAIRSVIPTCSYYSADFVGIYSGYQGIINKGGTFLKSARSKEFRTAEGRKKAYT